jgi:hypothetical protein
VSTTHINVLKAHIAELEVARETADGAATISATETNEEIAAKLLELLGMSRALDMTKDVQRVLKAKAVMTLKI